jgi:hypothetical protein
MNMRCLVTAGKHVPAKTISELLLGNGSVNTRITIWVLLETVFSIRPVKSGYKEEFR